MASTLSKFIPLFLILVLGYILRRKAVLKDDVISALKNIIVNIGLPSVFLVSFSTMKISSSDIWYYIATFLFCLLLLVVGIAIEKTRILRLPLSRYFFSGFEFGMVGVALFGSIYGIDNLPVILLFGLGHELFIWFIYAVLLKRGDTGSEKKNTGGPGTVLAGMLRSPMIIAIIVALTINLSGLYERIADFWLVSGIMDTAGVLAGLVMPLILLTIGSSIDLSGLRPDSALRFIGLRFLIMAVFGAILISVLGLITGPLRGIRLAAAVTFLLLPPPFIIPVFMPGNMRDENRQYSSMLMLYTIISIPLFMIAVLILG